MSRDPTFSPVVSLATAGQFAIVNARDNVSRLVADPLTTLLFTLLQSATVSLRDGGFGVDCVARSAGSTSSSSLSTSAPTRPVVSGQPQIPVTQMELIVSFNLRF